MGRKDVAGFGGWEEQDKEMVSKLNVYIFLVTTDSVLYLHSIYTLSDNINNKFKLLYILRLCYQVVHDYYVFVSFRVCWCDMKC